MQELHALSVPLAPQHCLPGKGVSLVTSPPVGSCVCLCPGLLSLGLSSPYLAPALPK